MAHLEALRAEWQHPRVVVQMEAGPICKSNVFPQGAARLLSTRVSHDRTPPPPLNFFFNFNFFNIIFVTEVITNFLAFAVIF